MIMKKGLQLKESRTRQESRFCSHLKTMSSSLKRTENRKFPWDAGTRRDKDSPKMV
jgi:hypothetical protein